MFAGFRLYGFKHFRNLTLKRKFKKFPSIRHFNISLVDFITFKMSVPKRYFVNSMPDYKGGVVEIPTEAIRAKLHDTIKVIQEKQGRSLADCDGGLYVGISGVGYAFYYLSTIAALELSKADNLKRADQYMKIALTYCSERPGNASDPTAVVGFLLGNAGTYTVAALLYNELGKKDKSQMAVKKYADAAPVCVPPYFLRCGGDELFVGRAGYLCGLLALRRRLGVEVISDDTVNSICASIIQVGREYSRQIRSPSPLMYSYYKTEYLGAAHGLSAILQMLLCFPDFMKLHPSIEQDVKGAVDFLLKLQQPNGNFPCAMDELPSKRPEQDELIHWCHGAPGVIYVLAKAYLLWKENKYLTSCLKCGDIVWARGLLKKGPGICHGIAGNGYVFLLLYRLTNDQKHLHRAIKFFEFLNTHEFKTEARTPDNPYSLYEGLAGTACFLGDLLQPNKAEFPFFDIF